MTTDRTTISAKSGFLFSSILIVTYIMTIMLYIIGEKSQTFSIASMIIATVSEVIIFLALRQLIVLDFQLIEFNIPIILLILFQILIPTMILTIKYQIISSRILVIPFIVFGLISIGIYLWFFILISKTEKSELPGLKFLQYFGITFLVTFIIDAVFSISAERNNMTQNMTQNLIRIFADMIPIAFVTLFFLHIIRTNSKNKNIPIA
jgi:hypothetical protein